MSVSACVLPSRATSACLWLVVSCLAARAGGAPPKNVDVTNAVFDAATGTLSFTVQNSSDKNVIAYVLDVTYTIKGGKTVSLPCVSDHTGEIPFAPFAVTGSSDVHVGPLLPSQREFRSLGLTSAPPEEVIVSASATPVATVFEDNTVAGDAARASLVVFRPHRVLGAVYARYVSALQSIQPEAGIRAQVDALRLQYTDAAGGSNLMGLDSTMDTPVGRPAYQQIAFALATALRQIDRGARSPSAILSSAISDAQSIASTYDAHSAPIQ